MSNVAKATQLFYNEGSSDKVYNIGLVSINNKWNVSFQYGRRTKALVEGEKFIDPVPFNEAEKAYHNLLKSKLKKGYQEVEDGSKFTPWYVNKLLEAAKDLCLDGKMESTVYQKIKTLLFSKDTENNKLAEKIINLKQEENA